MDSSCLSVIRSATLDIFLFARYTDKVPLMSSLSLSAFLSLSLIILCGS